MVALGLNRWNWQSPAEFAVAAARAEAAGIDAALLPVNPLACPDPYVLMAAGGFLVTFYWPLVAASCNSGRVLWLIASIPCI